MFFKSFNFFKLIDAEKAGEVIENELNETWRGSFRYALSCQGVSCKHWCCARPMTVFKNTLKLCPRTIFACLSCATYVHEGCRTHHDILKLLRVQQLREQFPDKWIDYKRYCHGFAMNDIVFLERPSFEDYLAKKPLKIKQAVRNLVDDAPFE